MKSSWFGSRVFLLLSLIFYSTAFADDIPKNVNFTTRAITPFAIEGLTMDATGNFYTTGRQPNPGLKCPVWRISPDGTQRFTIGFIPNQANTPPTSTPCGPSGITFDSVGNLYIADGAIAGGAAGFIWQLPTGTTGCMFIDDSSQCTTVPNATEFARNVPGANGLAFDRDDNLWTGDGVTGLGRVWKITGAGANCDPSALSKCTEAFRVQAMANDINPAVSGVANVGSDRRALPGGTIGTVIVANTSITFRTATNTGNSQMIVANGVAFNKHGDLFVADTARGAIWKVEFDSKGKIKNQMNCDSTFTANTLCLEAVFVQHPYLEGADGIALDEKGNIWVDANERNAVVVVTTKGEVIEVFRNPVVSSLRNGGPLEFPTSPFLLKKQFCTSNSDNNRRDNSPNTGGQIKPAGPGVGKISCMDDELKVPGLKLPVH